MQLSTAAISSNEAKTPIVSGIIASVLVAAFTIFLFYSLQDYGPESVLRKFNQASAEQNQLQINVLSRQGSRDASTQDLSQTIYRFASNNARMNLIGMQRTPLEVRLEVGYELPSHQVFPLIFVLDKVGRDWKVDAQASLLEMKRAFGMPQQNQ